ncbi:MAG: flavodoxin domain-containing protein [Rhodospirillaceae bacterium]
MTNINAAALDFTEIGESQDPLESGIAMRRLLIVYGTTEGQTQKIAEYLASEARAFGHTCNIYNVASLPPDLDLAQFPKIIVAASVHAERHQASVAQFVRRALPSLQKAQTAFLSVSLSAAGDAKERYDAWEYSRKFLSEVDWSPTKIQIVAGALRFSEHDFFKRWAMRRLAKEKRADRDQDGEYTDWAELHQFLKDFLGPLI